VVEYKRRFLVVFTRITSNPGVLNGKPCIRGTRISVEFLLELVTSGANREDILKAYPQLVAEDVDEALRYATHFLKNEVLISAEVNH
jgi:uncharacterized protein (DUF433 family)